MEYESTDNIAIVYETLKNIEIAINRLMERSMEIHNVGDYLTSPIGMEKLVVVGTDSVLISKQKGRKIEHFNN